MHCTSCGNGFHPTCVKEAVSPGWRCATCKRCANCAAERLLPDPYDLCTACLGTFRKQTYCPTCKTPVTSSARQLKCTSCELVFHEGCSTEHEGSCPACAFGALDPARLTRMLSESDTPVLVSLFVCRHSGCQLTYTREVERLAHEAEVHSTCAPTCVPCKIDRS